MLVQRRQRQWVRRDGCCRTTLPTSQYLHRLRAYTQGQPRPMRRLLRQAHCAQGVDVHQGAHRAATGCANQNPSQQNHAEAVSRQSRSSRVC